MPSQPISAVPTHIITGFLGVGKTTAIMHLLASKPKQERWAILVNEFGEIGVDGSLFETQYKDKQTVFIREVPGGCMCCTAGLPMQIALNQLLMRAKPDRLLIEPTGLGHPEEVLQTLTSDYNRKLLDVQKILTLVDARKLSDKRYTEHATFNQQIAIADTIVGNKIDLYTEEDKENLQAYVKQHGTKDAEIIFTQHGEINAELLTGNTNAAARLSHKHKHDHPDHSAKQDAPLPSEQPIPDCGFIKAVNQGENFYSAGWRFSPKLTFNHPQLFAFLNGLQAERMKAVFITNRGVFGYNLTADALTEITLDDCLESRVEIIANKIEDSWEEALKACVINPH